MWNCLALSTTVKTLVWFKMDFRHLIPTPKSQEPIRCVSEGIQHLALHCKQHAIQHVRYELKCLFLYFVVKKFSFKWKLYFNSKQADQYWCSYRSVWIKIITSNIERISVTVIQGSSSLPLASRFKYIIFIKVRFNAHQHIFHLKDGSIQHVEIVSSTS